MSLSKTERALKSLKQRTNGVNKNIELIKEQVSEEAYQETIKCAEEIDTLIYAYEKQIELNKKQNLKIKHQKGLLRVLQQKQGDINGKTNI